MSKKIKEVSRELHVLSLLCRPKLDKDTHSHLATYLRTLDIHRFQRLVTQHRVWPSVYSNLKDHFPEMIPDTVMVDFEKKYRQNQLHSRKRFQAHCEIIKSFEDAQIAARPLKGIPLAQRLYGDFSLRHSSDIDLLIAEKNVTEAHNTLKKIGFNSPKYDALTPTQRSRYFVGNKDITYTNADHILLELHVRLCEFSTPLSLLGARDLLSGGCMDRYYEFIYLCWHASNSQFHRIKWLLDIILYIEDVLPKEREDVSVLIKQADEMDELRPIVIAWVLSQRIFNVPLPALIASIYYSDWVCRWLVNRAHYTLENPSYTKTWRYKLECWLGSLLFSRHLRNKRLKYLQRFKPNINFLVRYPFMAEKPLALQYIVRLGDPLYRMITRK